ncbi:MAG: hypothetical protein A3E83_08995 [Gammaproteobacteria bacterium RIFCSPHIGHO2_12_FULL_41_20]|nr:MAG: hypothetical protein A3E83_08995 [Gammaproteobacteria bacterium RIFCSPHIGHO2_12_FULL_41_20]
MKHNPIQLPFYSFWLSLIVHLLLLISCIIIITRPQQTIRSPQLYAPAYIPSYVYTRGIMQSTPPHSNKRNITPASSAADRPIDKNISLASILASTKTVLQNNRANAFNTTKNAEPIYLIGDMNQVADPLIKLLGTALSANFSYPKVAGELGIKGRVLISLTLHPEGHFSDIQILQSSHNQDLDSAALYAVNKAPTVIGANRFLSEPKHFVIGFIFR